MSKPKLTDAAALECIGAILQRFPLGEDEPIDGSDAVDALNEIKALLEANRG